MKDLEFGLTASVKVTNTGNVSGPGGGTRPSPGQSKTVDIKPVRYAVSYWSHLFNTWTVEKGVYDIKVGSSSDRLSLDARFEVKIGFEWTGF